MPIAPSPIIETVGPVAPSRRRERSEGGAEVEVMGRLLSLVVEAHCAPGRTGAEGLAHPRIGAPWMGRPEHGTLNEWTVLNSPTSCAVGGNG
jgi:hypothetical protein